MYGQVSSVLSQHKRNLRIQDYFHQVGELAYTQNEIFYAGTTRPISKLETASRGHSGFGSGAFHASTWGFSTSPSDLQASSRPAQLSTTWDGNCWTLVRQPCPCPHCQSPGAEGPCHRCRGFQPTQERTWETQLLLGTLLKFLHPLSVSSKDQT